MTKTTATTDTTEDTTEPAKMRVQEALDSLNGFEQNRIEDFWGKNWEDISGPRLTVGIIAMHKIREGMSSADAWQAARSLTIGEQNDYFAPEPKDSTEADLSGKG